MDDVSDSLLDAADDSRGGMPVFVPIALALIGVALGGLALYFSLSGGKEDEFTARLSESGSQVAALEKRITELTAQNEKLQHDYLSMSNRLDSMVGQTSSAFKGVEKEFMNTRGMINKNAEALKNLIEKLNSGEMRPASRPAASSSSSAGTGSTNATTVAVDDAAAPGTRTHVIASGETFASVAQKYGVPLQKVLEANPDVDPRRLRIGQKIVVPLPANE